MKKIKTLIYLLLLAPTFLFAQEDQAVIHLEEEHNSQIFFEQNLTDFNDKFHSIFVASYKKFNAVTKENKVITNFQGGIKEKIVENEGKKTFSVLYKTNDDSQLAKRLQDEITSRILSLIPKGFVQNKVKNEEGDEITEIKFDPKYQEKGNYQPTIKVVLDYAKIAVAVIVNEPINN